MRFVGMFKASLFDRMPAPRDNVVRLHEVKKKCSHCGWVMVFHPQTQENSALTPSWRDITVKS